MNRLQPLAIVTAFALTLIALSAVGTKLLLQPFGRPAHVQAPYWDDAMLVAVGASTTTGLDPLHIEQSLSSAGQAVVLVLMQLGAWAWLVTGGLLIMRDRSWHKCLTLVQVVVIASLVIEGVGALLLWPALGSFSESLFLSVSAFSNTGYTTGAPPHPAVHLLVLGPLIALGQVMVLALDGRRTLSRSMVFVASTMLIVTLMLALTPGVSFVEAAQVGLAHTTGLIASPIADPPYSVSLATLVILAGGGAWLLAGRRVRWALLLVMLVVGLRLGALIVTTWRGDEPPGAAVLAPSATANSGVGTAMMASVEYTMRKPIAALMLVGRLIPMVVLAAASMKGGDEDPAA